MKNMIQKFDAILGVLYDRASNADISEAAAYVYAFGYLAMPERLNQAFLGRYS